MMYKMQPSPIFLIIFLRFFVVNAQEVKAVVYVASPRIRFPRLARQTENFDAESARILNVRAHYISGRDFILRNLKLQDKLSKHSYPVVKADMSQIAFESALAFSAGAFGFIRNISPDVYMRGDSALIPEYTRQVYGDKIPFDPNTALYQDSSFIQNILADPLNPQRDPVVLEIIQKEIGHVDKEIMKQIEPLVNKLREFFKQEKIEFDPTEMNTFHDVWENCDAYLFSASDSLQEKVLETKKICEMVVRLASFRWFRNPTLKKIIVSEFWEHFWPTVNTQLTSVVPQMIQIFDKGLYNAALMTLFTRNVDNFYLGDLQTDVSSREFEGAISKQVGRLRPNSEIQIHFSETPEKIVEVRFFLDKNLLILCAQDACTLQEFEDKFRPFFGQTTDQILNLKQGEAFYETRGFLFGLIMLTAWVILVLIGMLYTTVEKLRMQKLRQRNEEDNFGNLHAGLEMTQ